MNGRGVSLFVKAYLFRHDAQFSYCLISDKSLTYFLSLYFCLFLTMYLNRKVQPVKSVWLLLSFSKTFSRFIDIAVCISTLFLSPAKWYSSVGHTSFWLSIYQLVDIWDVSIFHIIISYILKIESIYIFMGYSMVIWDKYTTWIANQ